MLTGLVVLATIAVILLVVALTRRPDGIPEALRETRTQSLAIMLRLPLALLAAGFVSQIVPTDRIAENIGRESGWLGLVLASLFGAVVPGGPILTFPLALVVWRAGAGEAQMVAFIASWSIFAMHRVLSYELPMLGPRFVLLRLASSWMLPLVAGAIAMALLAGLGPRRPI